ncbi:hypothetical protein DAPPUDRAFT_338933 [Daphnia pulex]|uniref:Uncharacterized protein n=1 Tax=Daphnia pulex TaxID=6669 RepID=E9I358_DAPPU|nr:hypothetical protein DAPPUDRAFT_338933 [Daphnia pulex]|eukprot:EFX61572.1 hypothetical protein DAPPUDRAFT_338933 [Daphnia pulex]
MPAGHACRCSASVLASASAPKLLHYPATAECQAQSCTSSHSINNACAFCPPASITLHEIVGIVSCHNHHSYCHLDLQQTSSSCLTRTRCAAGLLHCRGSFHVDSVEYNSAACSPR